MKVIEKPWRYGTYLAYDETEDIFIPKEKGVRVLPAPFFYDKKLYFELKAVYAPGEKKSFPNGGYEVVDVSGGIRSYDLDQVIIHPQVIKHKKTLDKMMRRAEKEQAKRNREIKKRERGERPSRNTTGKRGRPALDPAMKAAREAEKAARATRSGGKRGRPAGEPKAPKVLSTGGRRGRPALTPEAIAQRVSARAATRARSGGKRGRPKSTRR